MHRRRCAWGRLRWLSSRGCSGSGLRRSIRVRRRPTTGCRVGLASFVPALFCAAPMPNQKRSLSTAVSTLSALLCGIMLTTTVNLPTRRAPSPQIWTRDTSLDCTTNGSAGVNSASNVDAGINGATRLGGQCCGDHYGRGDSNNCRKLADHALRLPWLNPVAHTAGDWRMAFGHHEDRMPTHGYAATREAAMAAFAKSWRRQ
jgi:hypothetical protein